MNSKRAIHDFSPKIQDEEQNEHRLKAVFVLMVEMVKKDWNELETLIFQYADVIHDYHERKKYREMTF
ncbi:MAG TPA: hypothetical protein DEF00_03895 [Candidatus Taylorbacteria bacterium]|nr:hypothetical protein [Candidatus Taylorbacteria bacterium]